MVPCLSNIKAENTEDNPNNVVPTNNGNCKFEDGKLTAVFSKKSWNVIRLGK